MGSVMGKQMEYHEACLIFPADDEHIDELAEDIKANGQKVPIELYGGKILDGRRRWLACQIAGIEPDTINVDSAIDDPVAHVLSLNLHRRHLTVSQASMCAARADGLKEKLEAEAAKRKKAGKEIPHPPKCAEGSKGESRDKLAAQFGVSHGSVDRARRVIASGNKELVEAVDKGEVPVAKAAAIAASPKELQKPMLADAKNKGKGGGKKSPRAKPKNEKEPTQEERAKSKAIFLANEAIDALKKIPKNDPLRKRGFQIVTDWIKANK